MKPRCAAWDLPGLVQALADGRRAQSAALTSACGDLPSRNAVAAVVDSLRAALFPDHYGPRGLTADGVDPFVGHTLDGALRALQEQVIRELALEDGATDVLDRAAAIVQRFAASLPDTRALLVTDIEAAFRGDPAARSLHEILFCYPGVTAITHHRLAHALYALGAPLIARVIAERAHADTGIDIHPGAQIGSHFFIDHGTGVVIGETSVIGQRVRLYQGVTLGARSFPADAGGALIKGRPRHPIVEDDVVIYAGATLLGRITIGRGASIGGNVWITQSVPAEARVTQVQAARSGFESGAGI